MNKLTSAGFTNGLSVYVITLCFGYLFAAAYLKAVNINALTQGQTVVVNVFMLVVGYVWGSSKGSAKKDDTIGSMLNPTESGSVSASTTVTKKVDEQPKEEKLKIE